jgi:hypothetical protein
MVWLVEKKVVHHLMDVGFEIVKIPIRVKFEYEVKEGSFVSDSLSTHTLYNKKALEKRYPQLNLASLENSIDKTVKKELFKHLRECGLFNEDRGSDACTIIMNASFLLSGL